MEVRLVARHRMPQIQFLYIGSRLCSALLSGPASRRVLFHPCASLSLHVHHVVKRTFTSKLSNVLGAHKKGRSVCRGPSFVETVISLIQPMTIYQNLFALQALAVRVLS
jgi:hypothetical protein